MALNWSFFLEPGFAHVRVAIGERAEEKDLGQGRRKKPKGLRLRGFRLKGISPKGIGPKGLRLRGSRASAAAALARAMPMRSAGLGTRERQLKRTILRIVVVLGSIGLTRCVVTRRRSPAAPTPSNSTRMDDVAKQKPPASKIVSPSDKPPPTYETVKV
jgi:hypothetical protein